MTTIARIRLENFQCYEGEQELRLEPKAYAITARHVADKDRSNALGKTSLVEAVRLCLHGEHRWRTEDEWITRGAKRGRVVLDLSDGAVVARERPRGKSTQLYLFRTPDDAAPMRGAEAQAEIDRRVGLGPEDFAATCWFGQKQMSRLVTSDPGTRMEVVSSWLRLEPLERAWQWVSQQARAHEDRAAEREGRRRALQEQRAQELERALPRLPAPERTAEQLQALAALLGEQARGAEAAAQAAADAAERNHEALRAQQAVAAYEAVKAEGRAAVAEALKHDLAALKAAAEKALASERALSQTLYTANARATERAKLAKGQFDGRCPVADIECPARAQINARRAENAKAYDDAEQARNAVRLDHDAADKEMRRTDAALQAGQRAHDRVQDLRERAKRAREAAEVAGLPQPRPAEELRAELDRAQAAAREALSAALAASKAQERVAAIDAALAGMEAADPREAEALATHREAMALLGRNGAQRRVAEDTLGELEGDANALLQQVGIDLQVGVAWAREGKGLAKTCDACGSPFPDSARVKACPRCGAARGPHLVSRLDVNLSRSSGAMEDLGGAALQLAASAWLRQERGAAWASAFLDEPLGAVDAAYRRALAGGLARMLRECGFEQSFVIAHHASMLDALPGRIEIESDGERATARVVA